MLQRTASRLVLVAALVWCVASTNADSWEVPVPGDEEAAKLQQEEEEQLEGQDKLLNSQEVELQEQIRALQSQLKDVQQKRADVAAQREAVVELPSQRMELLQLLRLRRHDVVARPRGRQRRRVELDEVAARIKGREGRGLGQEPHGVEGLVFCHRVLFVVWGSPKEPRRVRGRAVAFVGQLCACGSGANSLVKRWWGGSFPVEHMLVCLLTLIILQAGAA